MQHQLGLFWNKYWKTVLSGILLVMLIIGGFTYYQTAFGVTYTWDGEGATNDWSDCDNWSSDTCPDSGDSVLFNATSIKDATFDSAATSTLVNLSLASGYTGTVTISKDLNVTGQLILADGTFLAPTTNLSVTDFIHTGGTFTHRDGTVRFGDTGMLQSLSNTTFSNVSIGYNQPLNSMIAYYKLDESTANTTVVDSSDNGFNGTPYGTGGANNYPQPTTDVPPGIHFLNSYALDFDGTNDEVIVPYNAAFEATDDLTVSFWVKLDGAGALDGIVARRESSGSRFSWIVAVNSSRNVQFYTSTSGFNFPVINSSITLSLDTWHHILVTNDASNGSSGKKIYIDGIERGSGGGTTLFKSATAQVYLGRDACCGDRFFDGTLDDVRIYSEVLTADERALLFNGLYEYTDFVLASTTLHANTLDTDGNLLIVEDSTLDVSTSSCSGSCDIEVAGDVTNYGTFMARTGNVTFNGTDQTLTGSTTFYNFIKNATASSTLRFEAGSLQTITNLLTLRGAISTFLSLRSTVPGSQWFIDAPGIASRSIDRVLVQDSNNTGAESIEVQLPTSNDAGNNTNWTFLPPREIFRLNGGLRLIGDILFR